MMYNKILVRYGDLTLKGRNRKIFVQRVVNLVKEKLDGLKTTLEITHDRIYVAINGEDTNEIIKRLSYVSGIVSYSLVVRVDTTTDMQQIKEAAVNLINEQIKGDVKFKIESKRSDKTFPLTSLEISKEVSSYVLKHCKNLHVDVHNPEETLYIELRNKDTYLYFPETEEEMFWRENWSKAIQAIEPREGMDLTPFSYFETEDINTLNNIVNNIKVSK